MTLVAAVVLSVASCAPGPKGTSDAASAEDAGTLRFQGTVIALDPTPASRAYDRWIVTMTVDEVIEGVFADQTFSFLVHSPEKSGLQQGTSYTVRAERSSSGFTVDQYQWMQQVDEADVDKPSPN
jgi:hypothetical protein